jgi:general secretion pathway protein I
LKLTAFSALRRSKGFSLLEVMVAFAILSVAIVTIFQLFATALRTTKKAADYTNAVFYARSMLDEAYSVTDPTELSSIFEFEEGFEGKREVSLVSESEDNGTKLYEVTVTVTWPTAGSLVIKGLRTVYETE